jgi:hypothetical protein
VSALISDVAGTLAARPALEEATELTVDDAQLVRAARKGDEGALAAQLERHERAL